MLWVLNKVELDKAFETSFAELFDDIGFTHLTGSRYHKSLIGFGVIKVLNIFIDLSSQHYSHPLTD